MRIGIRASLVPIGTSGRSGRQETPSATASMRQITL
jgi:hypothetical protein